jgi:hypothetical protein
MFTDLLKVPKGQNDPRGILTFNCLTLKIKALHPFESLVIIYRSTRPNIPEELNDNNTTVTVPNVWEF